MKLLLKLRAKLAWMWKLGLIERTTAFRWEMDVALGEVQPRLARFAIKAGFMGANHLDKAADELAELREAPKDPNEMADVVLAIALHAEQNGVDLAEAIKNKLDVVMRRQYGKPDHRGVVRHVTHNKY